MKRWIQQIDHKEPQRLEYHRDKLPRDNDPDQDTAGDPQTNY